MDWCKMAVFLYGITLTHFFSDFLNHWMEKKRALLVLHCFLYAIFFAPIFWWLEINLFWLILLFGSHLLIDSQRNNLEMVVRKVILRKARKDSPFPIIILGVDQVLHLLALFVIALIVF